MNWKGTTIIVSVAALTAAVAAGRLTDVRVEGKFATNDVLMKGGRAYVPLADMAKALDLTVQKTSTGYDLVKAGGANAVGGLTGKMGDMLFNGKYRFKVVKVVRAATYKPQFYNPGFDFTVASQSNEVVAVVCQLRNGTKEPVMIDITGGKNTALTDDSDHSYQNFTGSQIDMPERAPKLLPGAAYDFALTFDVPKTAVLKDLVFTVNDLSGRSNPDFRVSLKQ
jgi:hypothetical protein